MEFSEWILCILIRRRHNILYHFIQGFEKQFSRQLSHELQSTELVNYLEHDLFVAKPTVRMMSYLVVIVQFLTATFLIHLLAVHPFVMIYKETVGVPRAMKCYSKFFIASVIPNQQIRGDNRHVNKPRQSEVLYCVCTSKKEAIMAFTG